MQCVHVRGRNAADRLRGSRGGLTVDQMSSTHGTQLDAKSGDNIAERDDSLNPPISRYWAMAAESVPIGYDPATYIETATGNKLSRHALLRGPAAIRLRGRCVVCPDAILRGDRATITMGRYCEVGRGAILTPSLQLGSLSMTGGGGDGEELPTQGTVDAGSTWRGLDPTSITPRLPFTVPYSTSHHS